MTLLNELSDIRERLDAKESPANALLKQEILALAEILGAWITNTSQYHQQVAAAVAALSKDVESLSSLSSRVSDLEKNKS